MKHAFECAHRDHGIIRAREMFVPVVRYAEHGNILLKVPIARAVGLRLLSALSRLRL